MKRHLLKPIALSLLASGLTASIQGYAEDLSAMPPVPRSQHTLPESSTPSQYRQQPTGHATPWLGVQLVEVPQSLAAQLGGLIPQGQGVMIESVAANSPAEQAGLQRHDILLRLGEQKLYSARQLSSLLRSMQPGSEVVLQTVHQGKLKEVTVSLGERNRPNYDRRSPWPHAWSDDPQPQNTPPLQGGDQRSNLAWDSFESVEVRSLADGRYRAEVAYKDVSGNQKSFIFEGNRDEIIGQIKDQDDLPQEKKRALLNALNMRPDGGIDYPFSRRDLFGDRFFNDPSFRGFDPEPFSRYGFPEFPDLERFFRNPFDYHNMPRPAPDQRDDML
jgi:hypothetical protein